MKSLSAILLLVLAISMLSSCVRFRRHEVVEPAQGDHPLVGTWVWDDGEIYQYVFHANGEGTRGYIPIVQSFRWTVEDDHLDLRFRFLTENWTYAINNNVLTIDSRQVNNMTYSYIRAD